MTSVRHGYLESMGCLEFSGTSTHIWRLGQVEVEGNSAGQQ